MAWLGICFGIFNNCGVWSSGVVQDKSMKNYEEHDKDSAEEEFQLTKVRFNRESQGDSAALGMSYCSINIWDRSELKLSWSRKNIWYFKNSFSIFLLSGRSKSVSMVCDVLRWVHFLKWRPPPMFSLAPSVVF